MMNNPDPINRPRNERQVFMTSGVTVTNPDEWHIYPTGAHHKLTECSPTLHFMVAEYRPELIGLAAPSVSNWRDQVYDTGTPVYWAQKLGGYLESMGIQVQDYGDKGLTWNTLVQIMADGYDDLIDNYRRHQKEKEEGIKAMYTPVDEEGIKDEDPRTEATRRDEDNAAYFQSGWVSALRETVLQHEFNHDPIEWARGQINHIEGNRDLPSAPENSIMTNHASLAFQSTPSTPQAPHKCARAMLIVHNDKSETMMSFDHPIAQKGWKFNSINGVPMLIVGHGVPRRHIPLNNVKFMDLLTEDEL